MLLSGRGPVFCAGADLKERTGKDAAWVRRRRLASFAAYAAIELAGCRSSPSCRVRSSARAARSPSPPTSRWPLEGTVFRFPEPHWGTVGATQRLQRDRQAPGQGAAVHQPRARRREAADLGVVTGRRAG